MNRYNAYKFSSVLIILFALLLFIFCANEKPTAIDGTISARFMVVDTSGTLADYSLSQLIGVPGARIRMNSIDYSAPLRYETDENGFFEIKNILAGRYRISADKFFPADSMLNLGKKALDVMLTGSAEIDLSKPQPENNYFIIEVGASFLSSIVINEIYYSCPANSGLYFSDQFIELYNASDTTQYLDQILICRMASLQEFPGQAEAIRYYQFPGSGMEHPMEPEQFVVVAMDAVDHVNDGGAIGSIDLTNADWEFYNQLYSDLDNPNVPNVLNASPERGGWDFMINLSTDEVCIIRVDDLDAVPFYEESHKLFNIADIIDGVEYSYNPDHIKALDYRIDAGLAGYTITTYTGKSIERHHPETGGPGYDTNNSTFDFVSLYHPTPGWQHSAEDVIPR